VQQLQFDFFPPPANTRFVSTVHANGMTTLTDEDLQVYAEAPKGGGESWSGGMYVLPDDGPVLWTARGDSEERVYTLVKREGLEGHT
jgi:hypothetical protein